VSIEVVAIQCEFLRVEYRLAERFIALKESIHVH